jgi:excisionase family DNA binding protein
LYLNIPDERGDEVMKKEADKVPVWEKYTLTIAEASDYFNIGENKLRRFLSEHKGESYILMNGTKVLIKRKQFEKIIDELGAI